MIILADQAEIIRCLKQPPLPVPTSNWAADKFKSTESVSKQANRNHGAKTYKIRESKCQK